MYIGRHLECATSTHGQQLCRWTRSPSADYSPSNSLFVFVLGVHTRWHSCAIRVILRLSCIWRIDLGYRDWLRSSQMGCTLYPASASTNVPPMTSWCRIFHFCISWAERYDSSDFFSYSGDNVFTNYLLMCKPRWDSFLFSLLAYLAFLSALPNLLLRLHHLYSLWASRCTCLT